MSDTVGQVPPLQHGVTQRRVAIEEQYQIATPKVDSVVFIFTCTSNDVLGSSAVAVAVVVLFRCDLFTEGNVRWRNLVRIFEVSTVRHIVPI
ncbi:hypothetical protein HPB47_013486 [Ixodes persulcatus]|uniref:Uncharacterized protein n=1 Tax=Ixodes persulcatus TaxID=34615 RepID=A0AC60R1T2_IXOPE|nr:hypothetical protein HPB47_013486 [Ixodes persulcatus]